MFNFLMSLFYLKKLEKGVIENDYFNRRRKKVY